MLEPKRGGAQGSQPFTQIVGPLLYGVLVPLNTLITGKTADGKKAGVLDYAAAPLQILTALPMEGGEGGGFSGKGPEILPDDFTVVRGSVSTPEKIATGTGTHPSGVHGFSVECANCSVAELGSALQNNQVRVTTVGKVREAGGDVIRTSGSSPNHATVTGLSPETATELLTPPVKNPTPKKTKLKKIKLWKDFG